MSNRLKGKWALVTGASSGFGAETARQLAAMGANLLLGARREDRLGRVAAECLERGAASAHIHKMDVTRTASVNAFADWAKATAGRVDVLVNNAGGAHGVEHVEDGRDDDWEAMFQSNALGILRVTRAVLPLMKPHPGGIILNIGSIAGRVAYEGGSAYCASKAAERSITKSLRLELNGTGLRVGTIDPGMAETEFSVVRLKGDRAKADAVYRGVEPLSAGDVAEAIVWAANRPAHVCIDEILMMCTAQAAPYKVHRVEE
ncbi:MAG: SDR family NAD(P)-dependent oxidoreductase [Pedosphaera sp.]|jgi:NADP-dependent 3-hydroxy acid dehydrogenase YdfG|nr:SDR family NAD(P)-dependent oxidoreductase [Pedosphaera sp.]